MDALKKANAEDHKVFSVPGAFELPLAAKKLARRGGYDAIIALGAVIRGDTPHFGLLQFTNWKQRSRQLGLVESVQKVALVLAHVEPFEQLESTSGAGAQARYRRIRRNLDREPMRCLEEYRTLATPAATHGIALRRCRLAIRLSIRSVAWVRCSLLGNWLTKLRRTSISLLLVTICQ